MPVAFSLQVTERLARHVMPAESSSKAEQLMRAARSGATAHVSGVLDELLALWPHSTLPSHASAALHYAASTACSTAHALYQSAWELASGASYDDGTARLQHLQRCHREALACEAVLTATHGKLHGTERAVLGNSVRSAGLVERQLRRLSTALSAVLNKRSSMQALALAMQDEEPSLNHAFSKHVLRAPMAGAAAVRALDSILQQSSNAAQLQALAVPALHEAVVWTLQLYAPLPLLSEPASLNMVLLHDLGAVRSMMELYREVERRLATPMRSLAQCPGLNNTWARLQQFSEGRGFEAQRASLAALQNHLRQLTEEEPLGRDAFLDSMSSATSLLASEAGSALQQAGSRSLASSGLLMAAWLLALLGPHRLGVELGTGAEDGQPRPPTTIHLVHAHAGLSDVKAFEPTAGQRSAIIIWDPKREDAANITLALLQHRGATLHVELVSASAQANNPHQPPAGVAWVYRHLQLLPNATVNLCQVQQEAGISTTEAAACLLGLRAWLVRPLRPADMAMLPGITASMQAFLSDMQASLTTSCASGATAKVTAALDLRTQLMAATDVGSVQQRLSVELGTLKQMLEEETASLSSASCLQQCANISWLQRVPPDLESNSGLAQELHDQLSQAVGKHHAAYVAAHSVGIRLSKAVRIMEGVLSGSGPGAYSKSLEYAAFMATAIIHVFSQALTLRADGSMHADRTHCAPEAQASYTARLSSFLPAGLAEKHGVSGAFEGLADIYALAQHLQQAAVAAATSVPLLPDNVLANSRKREVSRPSPLYGRALSAQGLQCSVCFPHPCKLSS